LGQNCPNPFNPNTVIRYDVPRGGGQVTLRIYNVTGQLVRTLVSGFEAAGHRSATWDATDDRGQTVSTGIYFYQLKAEGFSETRKMLLMK
jgi:flagellar hook assembly protein FlgD